MKQDMGRRAASLCALAAAGVLGLAAPAMAQIVAAAPTQAATSYTRYELLAPESGKFKITYDLTQYRAGASTLFNPIRKGSVATDESVIDLATGKPIAFSVVSGKAAKAEGETHADPDTDYIRMQLLRPVPAGGGEGRVRIFKTYEDKPSYHPLPNGDLLFDRPLGVKRNAIVLPPGYSLVSCNVPVQVAQEADGRMRLSFLNETPAEAPLKIRATRLALSKGAYKLKRATERAIQTRDIVYFLKQPETNAFELYHDYTEDRAGVGQYVNVVRPGSEASNPSARNLDTGADIPAQILKGAQITAAGVKDPELEHMTPDTEIVLFRFKPLAKGESIRLRFTETYTDPGRYKVVGDEMVFDRSFGRAINSVVLPTGWRLTNSAAPAAVSQLPDGRTRLDFLNPRNDEVGVLFTAKRAQ